MTPRPIINETKPCHPLLTGFWPGTQARQGRGLCALEALAQYFLVLLDHHTLDHQRSSLELVVTIAMIECNISE